MELDSYAIITNDFEGYEFLSEGPKGRIRKVIRFQRLDGKLYNLGFGDWEVTEQRIDDRARSNNSDSDNVLATVAVAGIKFMQHHPQAVICARGTTAARTRLYQIGIHRHWQEISQLYSMKGIVDGTLVPFEPGRN